MIWDNVVLNNKFTLFYYYFLNFYLVSSLFLYYGNVLFKSIVMWKYPHSWWWNVLLWQFWLAKPSLRLLSLVVFLQKAGVLVLCHIPVYVSYCANIQPPQRHLFFSSVTEHPCTRPKSRDHPAHLSYSPMGDFHCLLRAELQVGGRHVSCGAIIVYSGHFWLFAEVCAAGVNHFNIN